MSELPWEDSLLERKLESDLKDLFRTLVAFANSVRPDHVAIILIGEKDDGLVQGVTNSDAIQKSIRKDCEKIYPPIVWRSKVYEKDEKPCIRVEIEYSGERPHFGGAAWVRRGSETLKPFSYYRIAYPQWANQAEALSGVIETSASETACWSESSERALRERSFCCTFPQQCSVGWKSGEYGG